MATIPGSTARHAEQSAQLFDSRKAPRAKGIGYPSCNTELALLPPNTKDPHGYYRDLGIAPSATEHAIRAAVRRLYFELHPDTGHSPDPDRLNRVKNIAEVLLDPVSRERYNQTPPGMRLMDAVYASELSKLDDLVPMDEDELKGLFQPQKAKANPFATHLGSRYDYYSMNAHLDPWQSDGLKAQLWYHFLIEAAPLVKYRRVIKVMMTDGPASYNHDINMMIIPRKWEPSAGLAMSLFTHVAGFRPGRNDPETRLSFIRPHVSE